MIKYSTDIAGTNQMVYRSVSKLRKIRLFSTGGTISSQRVDGTAVVDKKRGAHNLSEELRDFYTTVEKEWGIELYVEPDELFSKDSSNIVPEDWVTISNAIVRDYDEFDGFVVTHGTNTVGYTSAALSFALGYLGKPVVLTGAQVPWGFPGSDARLNLENSIRVAVWPEFNLAGVYVVFGRNIIAGPRVNQINEFDFNALGPFHARGIPFGKIGWIGQNISIDKVSVDRYQRHFQPNANVANDIDLQNDFDSNFAVVLGFPGMKPSILDKFIEDGIKAIIFSGYGAGDPNENLVSKIEECVGKEIPFIVTTQAGQGIASMEINEPGLVAKRAGAIPAYDMTLQSVVTKLSWLLAKDMSYQLIVRGIVTNYREEIDTNRKFDV